MRNILQNYFQRIKISAEETSSHNDQQDSNENDQLFDQDDNEEEDFEIPGFLRKQKF